MSLHEIFSRRYVPWCRLFANDIILIDETKDGLNDKLEQWRQTLDSRGFRLSRLKTEYLKCEFSSIGGDEGEIIMGGAVIPRIQKFKYLGLIMEENENIDDDIQDIEDSLILQQMSFSCDHEENAER